MTKPDWAVVRTVLGRSPAGGTSERKSSEREKGQRSVRIEDHGASERQDLTAHPKVGPKDQVRLEEAKDRRRYYMTITSEGRVNS
jgi:hypothetical protein